MNVGGYVLANFHGFKKNPSNNDYVVNAGVSDALASAMRGKALYAENRGTATSDVGLIPCIATDDGSKYTVTAGSETFEVGYTDDKITYKTT